jgi:energy-coupling factor transport system ATP-binding protein
LDLSINFKQVTHTYQPESPFAHQALQGVSFTIQEHSYTAIIGHTGSGKSTLIQHLNGLLRPTSGEVVVNQQTITANTSNKALINLRRKVGVVFQFPEAQLFEETVLKDIAFAPRNFGMAADQAEKIARKAAAMVQLPQTVLKKSPFELSGGQMRRVAIAGILAMQPQILVLDEPTAGLDPRGHQEIMDLFAQLKREQNLTVILVSHQMDDVALYADQVIVLEEGKVIAQQTPRELFNRPKWLRQHHLDLPHAAKFAFDLEKQANLKFEQLPLTEDELADELAKYLPKEGEQ